MTQNGRPHRTRAGSRAGGRRAPTGAEPPRPGPAQAQAICLASLGAALSEQGLDPAAVLPAVDLSPDALHAIGETITLRRLVDSLEQVAQLPGLADVGLRLAELSHPGEWGAYGYLALNARTVADALRGMSRFVAAFQQRTTLAFVQDRSFVGLEYAIREPAAGSRRQDAEASLGMFLKLVRVVSRRPGLVPAEVHFEHVEPDDLTAHRRVFGAPVYFERSLNRILFAREVGAIEVEGADPRLHGVLERYLEQEVARWPDEEDFAEAVHHVVEQLIARGQPSLAAVAGRLGTSPRTLQRRLHERSLTLARVTERVRRERAVHLLRHTRLEAKEVAFALGYAEPASFSKAFKAWTGRSPGAYRIAAET